MEPDSSAHRYHLPSRQPINHPQPILLFCLDGSCVLQVLVLSSQSLLHSIGYYRIILCTFYLEAGLAALVLVLGPQHYYVLAFFLTLTMYVLKRLLTFSLAPH